MATSMDFDSSTPTAPKRLSGLFPSAPPRSPPRDPRRPSTPGRPSVGLQMPDAQPTPLSTSTNPLPPKPPAKSYPLVPPGPIANNTPGPRPKESQDIPIRQDTPSISDLVNSLIKVNRGEEQKERIQKEIASITKNLHRAKQAQQFPSTIALFQQQLDAAKDELANHVKSISQHQSLSNQAQAKFNSSLMQFKPLPLPEKIAERVDNLETQIKGMSHEYGSTAASENLTRANAEIEKHQMASQSRDQTIAQINEKLERVESALQNPSIFHDALEYIQKIANSVQHQSKQHAKFLATISSLEVDVNTVDKTLKDKFGAVQAMVNAIQTEMKNSNEQQEEELSMLSGKVKIMKDDFEGKVSSITADLNSLKSQGLASRKNVSTNTSRLETDLEAQMKQATEQITAQEDWLASLRAQQQDLSDGDQLSLGVVTPTGTGGVLTRLAALDNKVKTHADILTDIKKLHSEVDVMRLSELQTMRDGQNLMKDLLEKNHNIISKKVETLTQNADQTNKKYTDLDATFSKVKDGLSSEVQQLQSILHNGLRGLETRFTAVAGLSQTVAKCEALTATHSKGIRSLEKRWTNITTGDLVNSMARAMQEMYPSVDRLSQQLAAYRSETEATISTLKSSTEKALTDTQAALTNRDKSQAPHVSPGQLKELEQLPPLLQKVTELSEKLTTIDELVTKHANELHSNLQERNNIQNQLTTHNHLITDVDEKVEEKFGEFENFMESVNKIEPLTHKVDAHVLQLQEVHKEIEALTNASKEQKAREHTDRDRLNQNVSQLEMVRTKVQELTEALKEQREIGNQDLHKLDDYITQLQDLRNMVTGSAQSAGERSPTRDTNVDELCMRLDALESQMPNLSDESFTDLDWGFNGLEKELKNLETGFKRIDESMRGYLKRLRKAEDTAKALKGAGDEPMGGQSISSQVPSTAPFLTPNPVTTPLTVPKGPAIGGYQPVQLRVKGQSDPKSPISNQFATKQSREQSQAPSGPSSGRPSSHKGKSAENRQIQNLKGKRRTSSASASDRDSSSSPAVESSPAPSSSAPLPFNPGSIKKDKKRKKKAAQAEENATTIMKRAKKRKHASDD